MKQKQKRLTLDISGLSILDDLSNSQAGKLFKAIKAFNTGEDIQLDETLTIAFSPIKNHMIQEQEKYLLTCQRRAEAGAKGGKAKETNKKKKLAKGSNCYQLVEKEGGSVKLPKYSPDDMKLAAWIDKQVKVVTQSIKATNLESWSNDIRLMREIDGRTHKQMCDLFQWANKDSFWCSNIMSPKKLREKWDQLTIQRGQSNEGFKQGTPADNSTVGRANSIADDRIAQLERQLQQPEARAFDVEVMEKDLRDQRGVVYEPIRQC